MVTLYEKAYAKVNLTLDVLGKRPDGYHDLRSVMQTISLCDDIFIDIETGKDWALLCEKEGIPCDSRNLAWKAARVFFDHFGQEPNGITIHVVKRIPSEAGLGGGSADAAAVLRALNCHYGNPFSPDALAELGAQVGSDVPFCVLGGTAMVEGRGEHVRKIKDMPSCYFVICKPDFSASTPVLYRKLDEMGIREHPDSIAMEDAVITGNLDAVATNLANVFEDVVGADYPELYQIKNTMGRLGAIGQLMSGSGSSVFAIANDRAIAQVIYESLVSTYPATFIALPV